MCDMPEEMEQGARASAAAHRASASRLPRSSSRCARVSCRLGRSAAQTRSRWAAAGWTSSTRRRRSRSSSARTLSTRCAPAHALADGARGRPPAADAPCPRRPPPHLRRCLRSTAGSGNAWSAGTLARSSRTRPSTTSTSTGGRAPSCSSRRASRYARRVPGGRPVPGGPGEQPDRLAAPSVYSVSDRRCHQQVPYRNQNTSAIARNIPTASAQPKEHGQRRCCPRSAREDLVKVPHALRRGRGHRRGRGGRGRRARSRCGGRARLAVRRAPLGALAADHLGEVAHLRPGRGARREGRALRRMGKAGEGGPQMGTLRGGCAHPRGSPCGLDSGRSLLALLGPRGLLLRLLRLLRRLLLHRLML